MDRHGSGTRWRADVPALSGLPEKRPLAGPPPARQTTGRVAPGAPRPDPAGVRVAAPPGGQDVGRVRGGAGPLRPRGLHGVVRSGSGRHLCRQPDDGTRHRLRHQTRTRPTGAGSRQGTSALARPAGFPPQPPGCPCSARTRTSTGRSSVTYPPICRTCGPHRIEHRAVCPHQSRRPWGNHVAATVMRWPSPCRSMSGRLRDRSGGTGDG